MAKVEIEFKFKVGDLVLPKVSADLLRREKEAEEKGESVLPIGWFGNSESDVRWVVKEILYQQCYNTFQIHYDCVAVSPRGHVAYNKFQRFTEFEIEAAPPFEVQKREKKGGSNE